MKDTITDYLKKIGSKGGKTTLNKHGKEHYQKLAKHMNEVRKQKKINQEQLNEI